MLTDTENAERDVYSASSHTRHPAKLSDKFAAKLPTNSKPGLGAEDGEEAETKLNSLDFMLSILQSDLGEFRDFGGKVSFQETPDFLIIRLANVHICLSHKIMHSGLICPMC